jgi:multicomponent Na+:H+ antiporter subunit E
MPAHRVKLAVALSALWLVLSDKRDVVHLLMGAVSACAVAATLGVQAPAGAGRPSALRFVTYVPWLAGQILLSNLRVARLALSPRPAIRPRFIRRPPRLADPRALTLLGTSITLTPGTLTVDIGPNEMVVHALDDASAADIEAGTMSERVRGVFRGEAR